MGVKAGMRWAACLLGLLAGAELCAQSGRRFASLTPWTRSLSLGGAPVSSHSYSGAFSTNPAAPALKDEASLSLGRMSWIADSALDSLGYLQPLGKSFTLTSGWSGFSVAPFDSTGGLDAPASLSSHIYSLGGAFHFPGLKPGSLLAGVQARLLQTQFNPGGRLDESAWDLGLLWRLPWEGLSLGVATRQLPLFSDHSPASAWDAGLSFARAGLAAHLQVEGNSHEPLRLAASASWSRGSRFSLSAGLAYPQGFHAGLDAALGSWTLGLNVAPMGDLGTATWASLSRGFAMGRRKAPQAEAPLPPGPDKPVEAARPRPGRARAEKAKDPGTFALKAEVDGVKVSLGWEPQAVPGGAAPHYQVYMSLLPDAGYKKAGEGTLAGTAWSQDMGVKGLTYFFYVAVLSPDGHEQARSKMASATLP